jgi:hypothetical protein
VLRDVGVGESMSIDDEGDDEEADMILNERMKS